MNNEFSLGGREEEDHTLKRRLIAHNTRTDVTNNDNPWGRKRVADNHAFRDSITKAISQLSAEFMGLKDVVEDLKLKQNKQSVKGHIRRRNRSNDTFSRADAESTCMQSRSRSTGQSGGWVQPPIKAQK